MFCLWGFLLKYFIVHFSTLYCFDNIFIDQNIYIYFLLLQELDINILVNEDIIKTIKCAKMYNKVL
jgi:hypothetical protein